MKIRASARRSGEWWAISALNVDGLHTQARDRDDIAPIVADAAALLLAMPAEHIEVEVIFDVRED
ncbi:transcriptional regulator [Ornithinicoccus hortensis]|uniref:Uncharacterized protein n=1 Tax=Ornithinicoccus hortensis TaxID=82346 RepID=A0A542YW16_9MICO|nr:transcriptional regulator [Ornithinicoccus hortensis]TQL52252.1 hypothetical protein FB467_3431 [Ornithinicoccus hortensis]